MDIQFVSEESLALAQYVTDYITKAEKSHMQETWEEIIESVSIYSRLWSFALRMLCSRECGLYEASDLLLGDHLNEKSVEVQWISVDMPDNRKRRLKDHRDLEQLAATDPESEEIFKENLHSSYYPNRPEELEDVCLHDFVANYNYYGFDAKGNRNYSRRSKPRFVNHRVYDQAKNTRGVRSFIL